MNRGYPRGRRPGGRRTRGLRAVRAALALLACAPLAAPALAQPVTETAQARVAVMAPGTMARLQDMDFGVMAQPAVAATVVLTPLATPTCGASAGLVRTGTCRSADFAVMGRKNWIVRIREMNNGTVTLTGPGGATMTVTNLTMRVVSLASAAGNAGGNAPGILGRYRITDNSGMGRFSIGGTLNIGANQAPGVYSGTLVMQVQFN